MNSLNSGTNTEDNCNPSCKTCNTSKSSFHLEKWRNELTLKINRLNKHSSTYRIAKSFGLIVEKDTPVLFYFERIKHG